MDTLGSVPVSIQDEKAFDIGIFGNCALLIKLERNIISVAIWYPEKQRFLSYYKIPIYQNIFVSQLHLQKIWENHNYISAGFWKRIVFIVHNLHYTLAPLNFFARDEDIVKLLQLNSKFNERTSETLSFAHYNVNCEMFYSVPIQFKQWLDNRYKTPKMFLHSSSVFLEYVLSQSESHQQNKIYLNILHNSFTALVLKSSKEVLFINSFPFTAQEDILYFVLLICNACQINSKSASIIIYGEVTERSKIFSLFTAYVENVRLESYPRADQFSFEFDELPLHKEADLFFASQI